MSLTINGTSPTDRLLIVDEDLLTCELLQLKFQSEGFDVDIVHDGATAMGMHPEAYALLIIDLMNGTSPLSGFQLAMQLRRNPDTFATPFIFLSKAATEDNVVSGLDLGADDFIPKPFSSRELIARVRSVIRRRKMMARRRMSNVMKFQSLEIDLGTGLAAIDGQTLRLSRTEFLILAMLMRHRGRFFTRTDIRNEAWDDSEAGDVSERAVDTNISRLRKKIGQYGSHIINRQGHGYAFTD
ncbi:MAG: response regulator transcription factor [Pseudoflavonifractor sp.]|nr:response regulator transcription factor [Alloprevotella sp.]MCM1117493.1 response regulator transcription factor [Pseudoflavonifractor sp.]